MLTVPCQLQQLQGLSCSLVASTAQSCLSDCDWLLSALPRIYAVDLQSQTGADAHCTHAATGHNKCGQQSHTGVQLRNMYTTYKVLGEHIPMKSFFMDSGHVEPVMNCGAYNVDIRRSRACMVSPPCMTPTCTTSYIHCITSPTMMRAGATIVPSVRP